MLCCISERAVLCLYIFEPTSLSCFQSVIQQLSTLYFVGDLPFDVHAGRSAGMVTVAVTTGLATSEYLEYAEPDVIFDNLTKATDWILKEFHKNNSN